LQRERRRFARGFGIRSRAAGVPCGMPTLEERPLPPGSTGLPWVGETLSYLKDGFGFIEARIAKHGPVFRTHLLGRPTVVISGPEACDAFVQGALFQREASLPSHIERLFGFDKGTAERSLLVMDGDAHLTRKKQVLAGFTKDALASYVPILERGVAQMLERWAGGGELRWADELKNLAFDVNFETMTGSKRGPVLEAVREDFTTACQGYPALPVNLPGTTFYRALRARDRLLSVHERIVRERLASPGSDALSRMLTARAPDGSTLSVDQAVLELHHLTVAGFIVFAEFVASIIHLSENPEVLRRAREEVCTLDPAQPLTLTSLAKLSYLWRVVMEVKRLCPIVPAEFAIVRQDLELGGYRIPKGWAAIWANRSCNLDARMFSERERFDPERFAPGRAEHEKHLHAFVPHGAGLETGHKCPGTDYATVFMQVFLVRLLRDYAWELPTQDLGYAWGGIPPEPKDGLRAQLRQQRHTARENAKPSVEARSA
jgi:cytochrome P450